MEHLGDDRFEQPDVVADQDHPTRIRLQKVAQPDDRVGVQVVGRLVEQQVVCAREQNAGQLDPSSLPARQRAQRLPEHPVGQPQVRGDAGGFSFGGVPAGGRQFGLGPGIRRHGRVLSCPGLGGHLDRITRQSFQNRIEPARRQNAVFGKGVEVAGARILRQIADLALPGDLACRGQRLTREDLGQGRFAGSVAAHQSDLVAGRNLKRHGGQQQPGARPHLDFSRHQHEGPLYRRRTSPLSAAV